MFNWILMLLAFFGWGLPDATPPEKDYIGLVAAEAAYASLLSGRAPVKPAPLVDPKNCPTCGGLGKVPSGDGQDWTKCPTCKPGTAQDKTEIKIPKSDPGRYKTGTTSGTVSISK